MALNKALPAHKSQVNTAFADNTQLMYLHAGSLLNNLRLRYKEDKIYVRDD